jgi:hypothetical protein
VETRLYGRVCTITKRMKRLREIQLPKLTPCNFKTTVGSCHYLHSGVRSLDKVDVMMYTLKNNAHDCSRSDAEKEEKEEAMNFKSSSRCDTDVFNVQHGIYTEKVKVFLVDEAIFR